MTWLKQNWFKVVLLIIVSLVGGFFVWQAYSKIERRYQACLEICVKKFHYSRLSDLINDEASNQGAVCREECREKYGK